MRAEWGTATWFLEEAERLRALASGCCSDPNFAAKLVERAQQCELVACHLMDKKVADDG